MKEDFFSFREKMIAPAKPAPIGGEPMTVQQLTQQIDRAIKSGVPESVRVRGELSNVKYHAESGHIYFTLKDATACIDCAMYRNDNRNLKFRLEVGMEVLLSGRVSVYASRGKYQLAVTRIEPLGRGSIEIAFRQLYEKLRQQGLFDPTRKKPLPKYPVRIVLVTSQSTAALQDMLKVFHRHGQLRLSVFHVPVQGDGAAERVTEAIDSIDRHCRTHPLAFDLILLARGGGSAEDLGAFNNEALALALDRCRVPIITGIGHEVDKSIADFIADHWAHTPTEAAQVAVAHWRIIPQTLDAHAARLTRSMINLSEAAEQELAAIRRHEFFRRPTERITQLQQQIDERQRALAAALRQRSQTDKARLERLEQRLTRRDPRYAVGLHQQQLAVLCQRLNLGLRQNLRHHAEGLNARETLLTAISPQSVLSRGYTITTRKKDGSILRSVAEVKIGDVVLTRFADGQLETIVRDSAQLRLFE